MLPIRNISYLLPMCCSFKKMHKQSQNWSGVRYPLNSVRMKRPMECTTKYWTFYSALILCDASSEFSQFNCILGMLTSGNFRYSCMNRKLGLSLSMENFHSEITSMIQWWIINMASIFFGSYVCLSVFVCLFIFMGCFTIQFYVNHLFRWLLYHNLNGIVGSA